MNLPDGPGDGTRNTGKGTRDKRHAKPATPPENPVMDQPKGSFS